MDPTYVVIIALTQIPVMFILMSLRCNELLTVQCYKRNPEWMSAHPEFQIHETLSRTTLWISYVLSAMTLMAIINFTWIAPTPEYYVSLLFIPQLIWLALILLYTVTIYKGVMRKIPLSTRKASLTPRRLSSYLPVWSVCFGYGLNALILGIYTWALMSGAIENEIPMRRLIGIGIGLVFITVMLFVSLRRKKSNLEMIFGPSGRKMDVRGTAAVLYLFVFVGIYRILGDFFGISLFSDITFLVIVEILIQAHFVGYSFHPKTRAVSREYRNRRERAVTA